MRYLTDCAMRFLAACVLATVAGFMVVFAAVYATVIVLAAIIGLASAHEMDPRWAQYTPDERNWLGEASTTERSRPGLAAQGFTFQSCCNHGDRVKAQLRSVKDPSDPLGYRDEWYYLKKGDETRTDEWVRIPNDVIHTEEDAEADAKMKNKMSDQLRTEGVLFIYNGLVTCFWPPEEGG